MTTRSFVWGLVWLAGALSGCTSLAPRNGAETGPFYAPANVHAMAKWPTEIRRVAMLPAAGVDPTLNEDVLLRLDQQLQTELVQTARAEIVPVSRNTLAQFFDRRQLDSTAPLPPTLLAKLDRATAADAVLFTDITSYSAYPPLRLGVRARLVSLTTGEVIWAFDNVFDAREGSVTNAARRHLKSRQSSTGAPADLSPTILQNPSAFAGYVGSAVFGTLPRR